MCTAGRGVCISVWVVEGGGDFRILTLHDPRVIPIPLPELS